MTGAVLSGADLTKANLSNACLVNSKMLNVNLNNANLEKTDLSGSYIYGISVWDIKLQNTKQNGLVISSDGKSKITVDNLEVAHFLYLILNNSNLRSIINTQMSFSANHENNYCKML